MISIINTVNTNDGAMPHINITHIKKSHTVSAVSGYNNSTSATSTTLSSITCWSGPGAWQPVKVVAARTGRKRQAGNVLNLSRSSANIIVIVGVVGQGKLVSH